MLEELIPTPQQCAAVFFNQFLNRPDFLPVESAARLKTDRVKPDLRGLYVPFDMNMRRLVMIRRIEEQSVRAAAKYCGQAATVFLTQNSDRSKLAYPAYPFLPPSGYS
jgi:hypothetical protein